MRGALRLLLALAVCCVIAFGWSASSLASSSVEGVEAPSGASAPTPPVSLAAPFGEAPQLTAQQVAADAASRTAFEGLDREAAVSLAKRVFQVGRASWTAPGSEPGESIGRYLGEDAAVDRLSNGRHVVVASSIPLRVDSGSGLAPTSLALHEVEGAYVPANPVVPVAIAKQPGEGIAFPAGLSVTPVAAASSEAPEVVGNRVLFANTARDTDWIAEPRPAGAEVSWQLRSQESPQSQSLAFHLPKGAMLQWSASIPGGVEVLVEGEQLMLVPPAVARDAEGNTIPTSYSLNGDVLTTRVDLSGNVAFPVLVDPMLFYGYYGTKNGANVWSGWQASAPTGYFGPEQNAGWYKIGTNPSAPVGTYGALTITAPGPVGKPGSAGITRVDLTGVQHGTAGQSRLISTINESDGPLPDYSYNGTLGAYGPLPLYEGNNLSGQAIAFCASGAGGHDGNKEGENTLCDEVNYQGHVFVLEDEITSSPQSAYNWVLMEGAQVTYRDPAGPNKVVLNTAGYTGQWLKTGPTNWKIEGEDEGLGLAHFELQIPAGHSPTFTQNINCNAQNGFTGCPTTYTSEAINLSGLKGSGEFSLAPVAIDAAENVQRPPASYVPLYIDQAPPAIGELSGPLAQAAGGVIGDGNYALNFDPTDGSTASPQSGVASVEIKVDGQQAYAENTTCVAPKGPPAENCFGLRGTWTMNGQSFGAGPHTITITAKDWMGNEASRSFGVTVNEAAYQSVGAGAFNLETGDYKLNPTDVSLSGGDTTLTVSRTYDSRKPTQGVTGPLGPQWSLSLPGSSAEEEWQSLTPLSEGAVLVYTAAGAKLTFTPKGGGGYNSPAGYQTETLTEPVTSPATYQLTDAAGNYTQFKQPASGAPFVPTSVVQSSAAGGLNKVGYTFTKTGEGITEPTEVLAPEPSEGACTASLIKGCRALTFNYATSTTATGEGPAGWGDYKGRLTRVYFTAWDPSKSEMTTTTVAQYAYDLQGRLRAEWDPRISPPLKTTYGYDNEGHITAVTPPGQEPWLLHYGTTVGDSASGRVLSESRPIASTEAASSEAPKNTAAPALSTTHAVIGTALSVSNGTWSSTPLAYSYEWQRCNQFGGECSTIPGATSQTYTPIAADIRSTLTAHVIATNTTGSTTATTATSEALTTTFSLPRHGSSFGANGTGYGLFNHPAGMVADAAGNLWIADQSNNRVQEISPTGTFIKAFGETGAGSGQFSGPLAVTANASTGNLYVSDSLNNRVEEFSQTGAFIRAFGTAGTGNGQFNEPSGLAVDASGNVWVSDVRNNRVEVFSETGTFLFKFGASGSGNAQFSEPDDVGVCGGNVYITDIGNNRIQEFTTAGVYVTQFGTTGTGNGQFTKLSRISCDATNHLLYATDKGGNRVEVFGLTGEFLGSFGATGAGGGEMSGPRGIAATVTGNVYIGQANTGRVEIWTPPILKYASAFGAYGTSNGQFNTPADVASDSSGNLWIADAANNRVQEFSAAGAWIRTFGSAGSGNGQFATDQGVAASPTNGNVYVTDTYNNRVQEFSATGTFVAAFGSAGSGAGQLNEPRGISIDEAGHVWVADYGNSRIQEFSSTGTYIRQAGGPGSGPGQLGHVGGITTCGGDVFASDYEGQRVEEWSNTGTYIAQIGQPGAGAGQFTQISRVACDPNGRVLYVTDKGADRIEIFGLTGELLGIIGSQGSGGSQFSAPSGLAIAANGHAYIADTGNNRIEEWVPYGPWQEPAQPATAPSSLSVTTIEYHIPTTGGPYKMDADETSRWAQTDIPADATAIYPPDHPMGWPAESYARASIYYLDGANRTVNLAVPSGGISTTEYNPTTNNIERTLTAENRETALKEGSKSAETAESLSTKNTYSTDGIQLTSTLGPLHTVKLASGSEVGARKHTRFFYDEGSPGGATHHLVTKTLEGAQLVGGEEKDVREVTSSYSGQENLGWKLHAPTGTSTGSGTQQLTTKTVYNPANGQVSETGTPAGTGATTSLAYVGAFGSLGSGEGKLAFPESLARDTKGELWIAELGNNRLQEFNEHNELIKTVGSVGTGNGQFKKPSGIAIDAKGNLWVADTGNNRIQVFNENGEFLKTFGATGTGDGQFNTPTGVAIDAKGNVWIADTENNRLQVFNEKGEFQKLVSEKGEGSGQLKSPFGVAIDKAGRAWVTDTGHGRLEVFSEKGFFLKTVGSEGTGNGQLKRPNAIAIDAAGTVWVGDSGNDRLEAFNEQGEYIIAAGSYGTGAGQFGNLGTAIIAGIATNTKELWVSDTVNSRVEQWTTGQHSIGNPGAHKTQTIDYTAAANATHPNCGEHPEWANLPCQEQHAAQPESGLPTLPTTTYTYNLWDEPATTTDTAGTITRTTTISYDAAGRTATSHISSSEDAPLPTVTNEYSTSTGAMTKQTSEGRSITSVENTLGQQTSYTDADGNTTSYEYEKEADDRLVTINDGKGTQTFGYDPTTGLVMSVKDSAAGTFTAGHDIEGNIITEGYPNGMTATRTLNQIGEATGLEYVKTTHCTSSCTWYSETVTPSIHSQWLSQNSTLSKQGYKYDELGRLTEAQDTPAGKGCTVRVYALDEAGNRTSQTTREPGSEGKCATEGGTSQTWAYDTADRLDEPGVTYDPFGNTTTLPAQDAGSTALTSTYYVNDTLASQKQNGETIAYNLDPTSRTRETVSTGTTNSTVIAHYADQSDSPAWTANGSSWTRYITGIGGGLAAIQTNGETPVLQLANLHGDIIATAALSETETAPQSTSDTTEYGVPRTSTPAKYSWLGAEQRPTELPTGIINMGARTYIPQLGRFEQTDPQPGGSANAYAYTFGDPINSADPNGEWTSTVSYNYEAASTGPAESGLPESYAGPGAIEPPPVNMQIEEEFIGHPPWDASSAFMSEGGGGGGTGLLRHGGVADVLASPGEMNRYCTTKHELELPTGGCLHNIAWQNAKAHKAPWSVKKALLKCVFGAASYGLVGLVIDAVKLSPAGAAASCLLGEVAP